MNNELVMDTLNDTGGTLFICPECSFNASSFPDLMSHLNEAHSQETTNRSEAPVNSASAIQGEKRSRRKPAFSHQIVSQVPRKTSPVFAPAKVDPGSIHFWNRVVTTGKEDQRTNHSNGNINLNRNENRRHSNVTPPRPLVQKFTSNSCQLPSTIPAQSAKTLFSQSMQPIQKNFQCRICHLTYKNFHDCTAHIRRKHEMSHAQAGRYVQKLDADVHSANSTNGQNKIRLKVKSLPSLIPTTPAPTTMSNINGDHSRMYQCKYCPFSSRWPKEVEQHEERQHVNYSPFEPGEALDTSNGLSALMIDDVQELGERIDSPQEEMMIIEEDHDDDEEEALWKYQQEFSDLAENNNNHQPQGLFPKHLKRFQCPHCEHTSPTLTKLKLHIATHINVKPYMCSICGWRANLRWYIQCHAKKRHPNQNFEVLQLSHEEAEQTINAYMKERGFDSKLTNRFDSKHQYQCTMCQFRSNHPRYIQQHMEANHQKAGRSNNSYSNGLTPETNYRHTPSTPEIVYPKFSSHPNFNPNRLYYCSLCYRGYRWRYDVKRHHKTMHDSSEDEMLKGRNFLYLEYIPHLDGLITATMSSLNNHSRLDDEIGLIDDDDDLKLKIADARTVDDEEAATLMNEQSERFGEEPILINDLPEESPIIFEDDRLDKSANVDTIRSVMNTSTSRPAFKPYQCPHCFYRTNWRTDCLRHIRARHKIEPYNNGYYELPPDEAERTYEQYERTYGFVVSKKVLARFTEFRHIDWEDLKKSIWDKIQDKTEFEQVIFDRLRPNNYTKETRTEPIVINIPIKLAIGKAKRLFACLNCAYRSSKVSDLEKHICSKTRKTVRVRGKTPISIYECTKCSYRTRKVNMIRHHIFLHRSKVLKNTGFYSCSFCGKNNKSRRNIVTHIAQVHSKCLLSSTLNHRQFEADADFNIRTKIFKRSFIERYSTNESIYSCSHCPQISTSIFEFEHHRSCHENFSTSSYRCEHCSFASNSLSYTNQHALLHTDEAQKLSLKSENKSLDRIPINKIYQEVLGKVRRFNCPFCKKLTSNSSSIILKHIQANHFENSNHFQRNLLIGEDAVKDLLLVR